MEGRQPSVAVAITVPLGDTTSAVRTLVRVDGQRSDPRPVPLVGHERPHSVRDPVVGHDDAVDPAVRRRIGHHHGDPRLGAAHGHDVPDRLAVLHERRRDHPVRAIRLRGHRRRRGRRRQAQAQTERQGRRGDAHHGRHPARRPETPAPWRHVGQAHPFEEAHLEAQRRLHLRGRLHAPSRQPGTRISSSSAQRGQDSTCRQHPRPLAAGQHAEGELGQLVAVLLAAMLLHVVTHRAPPPPARPRPATA